MNETEKNRRMKQPEQKNRTEAFFKCLAFFI